MSIRTLVVPNWSFGRDKDLLEKFEEILTDEAIEVHYLKSDIDHNRTVSAFSGPFDLVQEKLLQLADEALDRIDLQRHMGVHPRIGALDVCPFLNLQPLNKPQNAQFKESVEEFASKLSERFSLPVYLYEKSERGRHEATLPQLRKGGFGTLITKELDPDFGPNQAHPHLGASVVGWRDWLIAFNLEMHPEALLVAKGIARKIREQRQEGDSRLLGVRALAFPLTSRNLCQVSFNLTLPDLTPVDPIVEYVAQLATANGFTVTGSELIGVINKRHIEEATFLPINPKQIVTEGA